MNVKTLKSLIAQGEGFKVEFKRAVPAKSDLAEELAAFANSDGGWILFGVDDNGEIEGFRPQKNFEEWIMNLAENNVLPPIVPFMYTYEIDNKNIIVLEIPKGALRPHKPYYIRRGSTKREASREEIRRLYQESEAINYDSTPINNSSIADIDLEKVDKYIQLTTGQKAEDFPIPLENLLMNKSILRRKNGEEFVTLSGLLLFGKSPQQFVPQSQLSCVRIKGTEMNDKFIDRKDFNGTLNEIIDAAVAFVERNTALAGKIEAVRRIDTPEYHPRVVRELVINAVAHRDYSISGSRIRIFVFDNRLEIISPGSLPNTVSLDKLFTGIHYSRNDAIFSLLQGMGYGERLGTGIPKILQISRQEGYPEPAFHVSAHEVRVVVGSRFWEKTMKRVKLTAE
ncbi:MAG: RNA-binding domain-containing protein, partial [bacterium]